MSAQFPELKLSQSEQQKYSILVNELTRRFEVLDQDISIEEKVRMIDHFTRQLTNSGYEYEQQRDIIESALKGILRKEERKKEWEFKFRCSKDTLEERERKKLTEATSWYKEKRKEEETLELVEPDLRKRNDFSEWRKNRGGCRKK